MGEKIVVGPVSKGLRTDVTPFVIDNDSFPTLINAYQWRGRVKRKRGTAPLTRLTRFFNSTVSSYNTGSTTITLDGSGNGNILSGFSLESNATIVPGTVTITAPGPALFTDPAMDGTLSPSGTINYATGAITIAAKAGVAVSVIFRYNPLLPVMGLEDLIANTNDFPGTMAFDTTYSYVIQTVQPYNSYDVSFYKNPASSGSYVAKTNETPATWNGQDYQQFWTTNYQGALWATNGVTEPFSITNIGMQFSGITNVGVPTATTVALTVTGANLIVGDFVFLNEFDPAVITGINFQSGFVTAGSAPGVITITLPNAMMAGPGGASTKGIVQYLTNRSDKTKDCIRFYDGDPTNGSATTPALTGTNGWVNFCPPLYSAQPAFGLSDLPPAQYYLVGSRMILPFKDRLLFIGPVVQTSAVGASPIYLPDTIVYSQNGTPYYTASFDGRASTSLLTGTYNPILVPVNQTATPNAYFEDQTGFGGFIQAGVQQPIYTASTNQDVLILGFRTLQAKLVYTGNDLLPFNFFSVNSELGSGSTFSAVNLDKGVISRGSRGYIITNQDQVVRIDLEIPDQVFQISLLSNGSERMTAQRDFINEWIYFTYPPNTENPAYKFPGQTLQYNYRDDSWAVFNESYTTYGSFRPLTGYTWATIGTIFSSWQGWNEPWNAGTNTLLQGLVIAGNQQGFVVMRAKGTDEATSLTIKSFTGSQVTCPNHTLNQGDYITISGCLGTISTQVNSFIFSVATVVDANNFTLSPTIGSGIYSGGGLITRMYVPQIQTKQFPIAWEMARKTRIGPQQYLLSTTANQQITLNIFLSQNAASPYNSGPIVPSSNSQNNALVYSTVLYTGPESTNLGLTPANTNLNMTTAMQQAQIWHRVNTSLLGDTVQLGFTMSDTQMRSLDLSSNGFSITGASQANPCVLTCNGQFSAGKLLQITGVVGMTQLNFTGSNYYQVIASSSTTVTINVDSTAFTAYVSGGTAMQYGPLNQFAEIELHGFVIDVSPSQLLA